jgi:hypothetical protein
MWFPPPFPPNIDMICKIVWNQVYFNTHSIQAMNQLSESWYGPMHDAGHELLLYSNVRALNS